MPSLSRRSDKGIVLDNIHSDITEVLMQNVVWVISLDKDNNNHIVNRNVMQNVFYCINMNGMPGTGAFQDNNLTTMTYEETCSLMNEDSKSLQKIFRAKFYKPFNLSIVSL